MLALCIAPTTVAIAFQRKGSMLRALRGQKLRLLKHTAIVPAQTICQTKRLSVFIEGKERTVGGIPGNRDVLEA